MSENGTSSDNQKNGENWRSFYRKTDELRKDFANRCWESVKVYLTLASILISFYSGLLIIERIQTTALVILGLLPFFLFLVSCIFWSNFKRECKRMYEQIGILMLIEQKLGLFVPRTEKEPKLFPDEEYYMPKKMVNPESSSIKKFTEHMMHKNDSLYGRLKYLFFVVPTLFLIFWFISLIIYI
jgi:hypothetical protein